MNINDIARLAGVSITTVSRAINDKSCAKETKQKVLKIIEKYEYSPNSFARYLGKRNHGNHLKKCKRLHKS